MGEWWNNLDALTRGFYSAAAFFSVFFIWQLIAALTGLAGDDADGHRLSAPIGMEVRAAEPCPAHRHDGVGQLPQPRFRGVSASFNGLWAK